MACASFALRRSTKFKKFGMLMYLSGVTSPAKALEFKIITSRMLNLSTRIFFESGANMDVVKVGKLPPPVQTENLASYGQKLGLQNFVHIRPGVMQMKKYDARAV
uniref:Uncharacterized protein n=1 Tax=Romanomermis culicivorax TaxID=13658 RepID=A0A915IR83_ROMCU